MVVKFIAHAGIAIEDAGCMLLVDPWFRDSTLEEPIIEGINGKKSIEFQIPPTKEHIEDYSPMAILISHFHTHHSPLKDITTLIENTYHDITLAHPDGYANDITKEKLGKFRHLVLRPTNDKEFFTVGPFTITAFSHTVINHLAWSIKSNTGHVLHLADGQANKNLAINALDPLWDYFSDLSLDLVFMSAGRNSLLVEKDGQRSIVEAGCFSPVQAARLIQKIKPKAISPIGNHNHSYKKNRLEFIPETSANEEELRWAMSWLAPETKFVPVRPSHSFSIGETFRSDSFSDTYL